MKDITLNELYVGEWPSLSEYKERMERLFYYERNNLSFIFNVSFNDYDIVYDILNEFYGIDKLRKEIINYIDSIDNIDSIIHFSGIILFPLPQLTEEEIFYLKLKYNNFNFFVEDIVDKE